MSGVSRSVMELVFALGFPLHSGDREEEEGSGLF